MIDTAVVLAFDSALYPSVLTYDRSRIMLPILGKPIAARMMEQLHRAGVRRFLLMIGEGEGALASYLHSRWLADVEIEVLVVPSVRNVGRVLAQAARQVGKPFVVAGYNVFTHANFVERLLRRYEELGEETVISVAANSLSRSKPYLYAEVKDNRVIGFHPQAGAEWSQAAATLGVISDKFVQYLVGLPVSGTSAFNRHFLDVVWQYIQAGGTCSTVDMSWILPVEMDYDLLTINKQFLEQQRDTHLLSELPASVQIVPPVRIDPGVSVGQGVQIGPYVYLETGSSIGRYSIVSNTVVLHGTVVHTGSRIKDAVLYARGRVEPEGS